MAYSSRRDHAVVRQRSTAVSCRTAAAIARPESCMGLVLRPKQKTYMPLSAVRLHRAATFRPMGLLRGAGGCPAELRRRDGPQQRAQLRGAAAAESGFEPR